LIVLVIGYWYFEFVCNLVLVPALARLIWFIWPACGFGQVKQKTKSLCPNGLGQGFGILPSSNSLLIRVSFSIKPAVVLAGGWADA